MQKLRTILDKNINRFISILTIGLILARCHPQQRSELQGNPCLDVRSESHGAKFVSPHKSANFRGKIARSLQESKNYPQLVEKVLEAGNQVPGISSVETHRLILGAVLDTPCGGDTTCQKLLPPGKINRLMDDAYKLAGSRPSAGRGNFKPVGSPEQEGTKSRAHNNPKETCGTLLSSLSLRDNGDYKTVSPLQTSSPSFDYSHNGHKLNQGYTGFCHVFSLLELLRHHPAIKVAKNIDAIRFIAEIWANQYGENIEKAIQAESDFLMQLGGRFSGELARNMHFKTADAKTKKQILDKILEEKKDWVIEFQTGYAEKDFEYLKNHGAPLQTNELRKISINDLGEISKKIARARRAHIDNVINGGGYDIQDNIKAAVSEAIVSIFKIRDENHLAKSSAEHRARVKEELSKFDALKVNKSNHYLENQSKFLRDLQRKQPMSIGLSSHAITLVGYDSTRQVFKLRDSNYDVYEYLEVKPDEILQNIESHFLLVPKP